MYREIGTRICWLVVLYMVVVIPPASIFLLKVAVCKQLLSNMTSGWLVLQPAEKTLDNCSFEDADLFQVKMLPTMNQQQK